MSIILQYCEPPEAAKPDIRWRLYQFKEDNALDPPFLQIHRQSMYMFGRDRQVADVPTDHPSCSKQHAVIQFRFVEKEGKDGMVVGKTRPYIIDLGSTNGTFINGDKMESERYYELLEKDSLKFGLSSREYVLLHEQSSLA